jgi:putative ABC transport system permease protein
VKEIGIRKVLGASVQSIMLLFVKEFAGVMLVAAVVACPLAYLLMNKWLNNYASRIDITATPFVVCAGLIGIVILLLIGLQTVKTALRKPVAALRTE